MNNSITEEETIDKNHIENNINNEKQSDNNERSETNKENKDNIDSPEDYLEKLEPFLNDLIIDLAKSKPVNHVIYLLFINIIY